jgi:hypothetical protein
MFTANIVNLGVTLYLVAVMKLGALGSALGSLLTAYCAYLFGYLPLSVITFRIPLRRYFVESVVPGVAPWIGGCVVWWYGAKSCDINSWLRLFVVLGAGFLAYAILLLGFCLGGEDRRDLRMVKNAVGQKALNRIRIRSQSRREM